MRASQVSRLPTICDMLDGSSMNANIKPFLALCNCGYGNNAASNVVFASFLRKSNYLCGMLHRDCLGIVQRYTRGEYDRGGERSLQSTCPLSGISPLGNSQYRYLRGGDLEPHVS